VGYPINHSRSPQLNQLIYRYTGYNGCYNLFTVPPEKLEGLIPAMRVLGIQGVGIAIPYKQEILKYLDTIEPEAEKIGAVNAVKLLPDGSTCGYNTDYFGFLSLLSRKSVEIEGKKVLICGMSGAGRAVRQALIDSGAAEILVASTKPEKGIPYSEVKNLPQMDVLVNCTPIGMHPKVDESIVGKEELSRFHTVVDVVYTPIWTKLCALAEECGLRAYGGMEMLVYQGIKAFTLFTGVEVDDETGDKICNEMVELYSVK